MLKQNELKPNDLRCPCDPAQFTFESTLEVSPLENVIGQKRAVRSIAFGLEMKSPGYNIFITGLRISALSFWLSISSYC